jgi:hypothetical protein
VWKGSEEHNMGDICGRKKKNIIWVICLDEKNIQWVICVEEKKIIWVICVEEQNIILGSVSKKRT